MFVYKKGNKKSHKVWGVLVDYRDVSNDEAAELCKGEWFADPRDCYKPVEIIEVVETVTAEAKPLTKAEAKALAKAKRNAEKSDS